MTLRLILMRHGKSNWDEPGLDDHDRPLNPRGREAAQRAGVWLREHGCQPDVVLASTSRRTTETWQRLSQGLRQNPDVELSTGLYLASPQEMLAALAARSEDCVMIIGHNPGTAQLAAGLVKRRPDHAQFSRFPTAAICVIDFDETSWKAVTPGSGACIDFVVPKDLL